MRRASATRSSEPADASSTLATTQRTATGWPITLEMPASMAGRRRSAASLRNACSSGKPSVTIGAVDRDRTAGHDERLGRWVRAELDDDRRPGGEELLEVRASCRLGGDRGGRRGGRGRWLGRVSGAAAAGGPAAATGRTLRDVWGTGQPGASAPGGPGASVGRRAVSAQAAASMSTASASVSRPAVRARR